MASYIYSEVQKAIGGSSEKSGFQKNWSPNKIRALYIMRDFILVVDYLSGPKLTQLNMNDVGLDLQNPSRIGSLNNLLSNRQLSCLEEIYVDEIFSQYPSVIDLASYAQSVINAQSRLRYYAYTSGINGEELRKAYYQALSQGLVDFTYAKTIGGIRYVDTENTDWYRKHNLRPQFYGPDADGGSLAAWFNKVEKVYAKIAQENAAKEKAVTESAYILHRIYADVATEKDLSLLKRLSNHCNATGYDLHRQVSKIILDVVKNPIKVPGLTKEMVMKSAEASNVKDKGLMDAMTQVITNYGLLGIYMPNAPFELKKLQESNRFPKEGGFLQVGNTYDRILAEIVEKFGSNPNYRYTVNLAIQEAFGGGVPDGALAKRLAGKAPVINAPVDKYIQAYQHALYFICGVEYTDLLKGR